MIVLDTHVWVWWVHEAGYLTEAQRKAIAAGETEVVGVSAISCWEIAKLVEYGRLASRRRRWMSGSTKPWTILACNCLR